MTVTKKVTKKVAKKATKKITKKVTKKPKPQLCPECESQLVLVVEHIMAIYEDGSVSNDVECGDAYIQCTNSDCYFVSGFNNTCDGCEEKGCDGMSCIKELS